MNELPHKKNSIREYLLGRVSDETTLSKIEDLLFTDEDFCSLAEITEDALINDYVFDRLDERDRQDFDRTLDNLPSRRENLAVAMMLKEKAAQKKPVAETVSFLESIKIFFFQPAFIGALALILIVLASVAYFVLPAKQNELTDLKAVYTKERPTEARISGFDHAPVVTTRGIAEERDAARLRRIELTLIEATENDPSGSTFHSLGIFYLTQQKFAKATAALERSLKIDPNNAQVMNDLGSSFFEKARAESNDSKLTTLQIALENYNKAIEADPKFIAALFNKALVLQELRLNNQARESWQQYLTLDPNSGWANEARKNLVKLAEESRISKTN